MKKITKVALACAMVTMALAGCSSESVKRLGGSKRLSGETVTQTRIAKGFSKVSVYGSPSVCYTQGSAFSVVVKADKAVVGDVKTYVENGVLVVKIEDSSLGGVVIGGGDDGTVRVFVTSPDLTGVVLSGSGYFTSEKQVDTDKMDIELKGSGDIGFKSLICDNLSASLVGSGDIDVKSADALNASLTLIGSGDMDVNLANARRTDIVLKGSGDIEVGFAKCGAVASSLMGSGDITLKGEVGSLSTNCLGSGDYNVGQLRVANK